MDYVANYVINLRKKAIFCFVGEVIQKFYKKHIMFMREVDKNTLVYNGGQYGLQSAWDSGYHMVTV